MRTLIETYANRLEAMKENLRLGRHIYSDERIEGCEARIRDTAKFIRDLKALNKLI